MSSYEDFMNAKQEAELTLRRADSISRDLCRLLVGRLRRVGANGEVWSYRDRQILCDLKRELKDFNMNTRRWKSEV